MARRDVSTLKKVTSTLTDWTAVAQNTIAKSATASVYDSYESILHIQAGLDSTTAHTGTKFIVQISGATSGDEDWQNYTEFVELNGTAASDLIEDDPLAAGSTAIALTSHSFTTLGKWLLIEDSTLANSELVFEKSQSTDEVVILDGTTNAHAQNTPIYNLAFTKNISLPLGAYRVRVVVDNSVDADGSTLDYKVRISEVIGL